MRDASTDRMGEDLTRQWSRFRGTKSQFMAQLPGVTLDQRTTGDYWYCTVVRGGYIYEVYSYGEEYEWWAKR